MTFPRCVTQIEQALRALPDVVSVEGDAETKEVVVATRSGQARLDAIDEALAHIGHVVGER